MAKVDLIIVPASGAQKASALNNEPRTYEPELAKHGRQALVVIQDRLPGFLPLIQGVHVAHTF